MKHKIGNIISLLELYKGVDEIVYSLSKDLKYLKAAFQLRHKCILGVKIKRIRKTSGTKTSFYNFNNDYKIVISETHERGLNSYESKIKISESEIHYQIKKISNGVVSSVSANIIYNTSYNHLMFYDVESSNIFNTKDVKARNKCFTKIKMQQYNKNALN